MNRKTIQKKELPEIPKKWDYYEPEEYMVNIIPDLTYENVMQWIAPENLQKCNKREFEQFILWDAIDGQRMQGRS